LPGAKEIADKWSGAFLVAGHQAAEHWRVDWREGRLTLLPPGELHDSGGDIRIGQRFDYFRKIPSSVSLPGGYQFFVGNISIP
jgi:hypothetical protein